MLNVIETSTKQTYIIRPFVYPALPSPSEGLGELLLLQTKPYSVRLNLCHHRQQAVATCRWEMLAETYLVNEIQVSIDNLLWSMIA